MALYIFLSFVMPSLMIFYFFKVLLMFKSFQKEKADIEKLKVLLKPEEFTATATLQSTQERIQYLDQLYQELEEHYKKTIERIAAV